MIELKEVTKIYGKKNNETKALDNISLLIANRGMVSITGESGCGKTTLLNVISGLDKVTSGKIFGIKKEQISFIFQDFQLIENLSVKDNLLLFCDDINKINDSLNKVEMTNNIDKKVNELSGGQKQRIAIARALCLDTQFILCDEPTGNLDSKNSKNIASLLKEISKDKLVLIVTHDVELFSSYSDRIIRLEDGKVISDQIINEVEDIEIDENQKSNKNIKFTFKNMLKIKKSLDFKNVTTKIFNILFSVVILLAGFISIDLFTNSHGDIVKKAAESYGHSTIDFRYYPVMVGEKRHIAKYTLQDLSKFGFNTDDCALGINVIYNSDQSTYDGDSSSINPQGFHYNRDEQRFDFGFSKFYVTDDVYSPLLAGKKHLEKNEIIISYEAAMALDKYYHYGIVKMDGTRDYTAVLGKKIILLDDEMTIVGVDQTTSLHAAKWQLNYNDLVEEYIGRTSYFYCNLETYQSYKFKESVFLKNMCLTLVGSNYTKVNIVIDEKEGTIMSGRLPVKSGEIALSKSIANKLLSSPENLVGYDIDVYSDRYEQKFTIVGITNDYTNVYKDDLNNPVAQEKLYDDRLSFNSIAIFNSKYSGRRINEIVTNKDFLLEGSSFDQSYMAFTYIRTIGTISLFLIGPVALILIFFQFVNAKQEIVSHRRIIGILKSMSISNSKIKRVFIIDLLIENGLSFILGIILSKPGINVINSIFIDRDVAPYDVIAYKPLILFVLIAIIIIISYISILITSWRLNRKSDIDLVHER